MQFWTGASLGTLERLHGSQSVDIPEQPDWSETLRLLRYAITAWEGFPQSSFRTLLRLGYFEAGEPPRPRLQSRWLGIAGEWSGELPAAEDAQGWQAPPLPGPTNAYLDLLHEWLRASRALFVKLKRRYSERDGRLEVVLEDGRGKQIPLVPRPAWESVAQGWELEAIQAAEDAAELQAVEVPQVETASAQLPEEPEMEIPDFAFDLDPDPVVVEPDPIEDVTAEPIEVEVEPVAEGSPPGEEPLPAEQPLPEEEPISETLPEAAEEEPAAPLAEADEGWLQEDLSEILTPELPVEGVVDYQDPLDELAPTPRLHDWDSERLETVVEVATGFGETPSFELDPLFEPEQLPDFAPFDLDSFSGAGFELSSSASGPRWLPPPLDLPDTLPIGVREQLEVSNRGIQDYAQTETDGVEVRRQLASRLLVGLSCLLELTARVACAGLAKVAPLPDPLRLALQQPVPPSQSVKLLHFAWSSISDHPKQVAFALLQSLFFEHHAPTIPQLHARWLGLPDEPMIGLQHVVFWTRQAQGQIQASEVEFQANLRDLLETMQLWLSNGTPLWTACAPSVGIRPDGHWSGVVNLGGDEIRLDPDTEAEEQLDVLLERWRNGLEREKPASRILDEIHQFVGTVAAGSGLLVQGPPGLGKSFLLTDLIGRQPQAGGFRCAWVRLESSSPFALESLNYRLSRVHAQGFPWKPLGAAAMADLQRHSSREQLLTNYFAALQERNASLDPEVRDSLRIVLLESAVKEPSEILWCHQALPHPFLWVATTQAALPVSWSVAYPPARLSIVEDDQAFEDLQLELWQGSLDWPRAQLVELLRRSGFDPLVQRLWVGALRSGLYNHWKELPEASETTSAILGRLLEDRMVRSCLQLLSSVESGLSIDHLAESPWAPSLRQLLQHYPWLVFEPRPDRIALREPAWSERLRHLAGPDRLEVLSQFAQYLIVKLNTDGELSLEPELLLRWVRLTRHGETAFSALQSQAFRAWKDEVVHQMDGSGQGHKKVELIGAWLSVLDMALQWARENSPMQLHEVLEEQLWSYSSRALTFRGLGRLHEALLDIEQAIAGFRPLVEQRPELVNGLAAAHNRRSEILRELGKPADALPDADAAVDIYAEIVPQDKFRWSPLLALALHLRSGLYQELGRLEEAENDLRRSLELYQPYRDALRPRMRLNLVEAYLSRASLAARREDGLLARDDAERSLELIRRFEENWTELRVLRARAQTQLAEAYRLLEEESRALAASDVATAQWRELIEEGRLDLRGTYGQELCRRGNLLFKLGQLDAAFEAVQPGTELLLQLVEAEGRQELTTALSRALLLRARVWQRRGRPESAKRDLSLGFHYLSNLSDRWESQANNPAVNVLVETVALLTQLQLAVSQREQAVEHLKTTLQWVNFGIQHTQLENRALLESLLGRAEQVGADSLAAHQRAIDAYNELVDEQGQYQLLPRLAEAHLGRARTQRLMGEEEQALADANQAVELVTFLSEKGGDPDVLRLLPSARFEAAEILSLLAQRERALEHVDAGLIDLELIETDLDRAEYLLVRARALLLRAGMLEGEAAAEEFSSVLAELALAKEAGAETQFMEAEVRRQRAEVLLRLGHTGEAVQELLGWHPQSTDSDVQAEQVRSLLYTMRDQARQSAVGPDRADAYKRLIQVGELLYPGDSSGAVGEFLLDAYREKAIANWDSALPWASLDDLTRGLAISAVIDTPSAVWSRARLLECRATLCLELGRSEQVVADVSRALESLTEEHGLLISELLWMRVQVDPLDAGVWGDLLRLESLAPSSSARGRAQRAQVGWLQHHGWSERAHKVLERTLAELRQAYAESNSSELAQGIAEVLLERFQLGLRLEHLIEWAVYLGDQLSHYPEIASELDLAPVWSWLESSETSRAQVEQFSQVWLALLAEHPGVPEVLFRFVPVCVLSLRLDDFDSSTWISLMDILERRVQDEEASHLDWEGKTLQTLLELPREQVAENPDLDLALVDCLRRWAELPPERLALTGVTVEQLDEWLMS